MTAHDALYSRSTGRRLAPEQGRAPDGDEAMAVLVFDDGRSVPLSGDVVIGREPTRNREVHRGAAEGIAVSDPTGRVSRSHLLLRIDRWQVEAIDLGSRNGTMVTEPDGTWRRIMPGLGHRIASGQSIRLADMSATIHHLSRASAGVEPDPEEGFRPR